MDRVEFESALREHGYLEVVDRRMEPNSLSPEHAHEFDARVLILEGEMTISSNGAEQIYHAGDTFAMNAGGRHAQQGGPQGVRFLVGCRYPQQASG
jgi:quercetin dioxygenase-like cupin family protein